MPPSSGRSTSCSCRTAIPTTSTGGRSRPCRAARSSSCLAASVRGPALAWARSSSSPSERRAVRGVPIEAVRAKHWISPGAPRAQPLGYLVGGPVAVWFAGDTARYPEMLALRGRVDVALLPVWTWGPHLGPGHLGPEDAAEVAESSARASRSRSIGARFIRAGCTACGLARSSSRAIGSPQWRHGVAPGTEVRVLRPGDRTVVLSSWTGQWPPNASGAPWRVGVPSCRCRSGLSGRRAQRP